MMNAQLGIRRILSVALCLALLIVMCWRGSGEAQLDRLRKLKKDAAAPAVEETPMALIPEGPFWMGRDGTEALEDERPRHRVWLDTYSMDLFEVSAT